MVADEALMLLLVIYRRQTHAYQINKNEFRNKINCLLILRRQIKHATAKFFCKMLREKEVQNTAVYKYC